MKNYDPGGPKNGGGGGGSVHIITPGIFIFFITEPDLIYRSMDQKYLMFKSVCFLVFSSQFGQLFPFVCYICEI